MSVLGQIRENIVSLWSLIVGLKITGKFFLSPQLTVHYPRQAVDNLSTFRGPLELIEDPDNPGKPKCSACMMCMTNCPSNCFSVAKKKPPEPTPEELEARKEAEAKGEKIKKKVSKELETFVYNYTLCSLCGTCVETCPRGSLRFSSEAYLAGPDKNAFVMDLLGKLAEQSRHSPGASS